MIELRDKSVLVLGLGITGLSLVRWLIGHGALVCAADSRAVPPALEALRAEFPQVELHCGAFRGELLDGIDLLAISPGVALSEPVVAQAQERGLPVAGDIELFAQALPQEDRPRIIAITGSNGKTTVTSMVGAMCRAAGVDTVVAGNIFPAVLDVLQQRENRQPQVWVLELSSFQLETTSSLSADVAAVLNVSEDHLDRYDDMGKYIAAKARIFRNEGQGGIQVLNRGDAGSMGMALPGRSVVTFGLDEPAPGSSDWGVEQEGPVTWLVQGRERVLNANELRVVGTHNIANALAALALCRATALPLAPLLDALREFKGLPHRVEPVASIGGVVYYDDSKGTNVGATVAALQGLGRRAVLIAGGDGKGQDFTPLKPAVTEHARAVVLIGHDAARIAEALDGCSVPLLAAANMPEAVRLAADEAQPGDAVLLSPACASFDMFRNYVHRAEAFIAAVHELQRGAA
jgi:UDP-N-acetylmuramoylalanine--D-glutamate ligase